MRPIRVAIPASGASPTVPLDLYATAPFITISIEDIVGVTDIDVEYTLDNIWDPTVTPTWFPAGAPLNAVAAQVAGRLVGATNQQPISPVAVRALNNNAASSGTMNVVTSSLT